jgi:hypothetical protein
MPARKVAKTQQAEEERAGRQQADTERYLLQIDKQTKRSFQDARRCVGHGIGNQSPVSNSAGLDL